MRLPKLLSVVGAKFATIFKSTFQTPKRRYIALMTGLVLLLAPLFTFYLQYRAEICDFGAAWHFFIDKPALFWYSSLIMLLISVALICIVGNVLIAKAILFSTLLAITFAHINKFIWRNSPLLPEDFLIFGQGKALTEGRALTNFVNAWDLAVSIISIILIITGAVLVSRKLRKIRPKFNKKAMIKWRIIGLLVSVILLFLITLPVRQPQSGRRDHIPFLNSELIAWNQARNYQRNGFIVGFIYNLQVRRMDRPDNYSREAIESIVRKYQRIADEQNADRIALEDSGINIIFVMNESFIDPEPLRRYYPFTGGEVTPNWRRIQQDSNTSTGWHYSSEYGGGTANIEFEALTGFSNYFMGMVPYTHIVSRTPNFPSFASLLNSQGYRSIGLHSYFGSMYKRNIVYRNLGFDRFLDESRFDHTTRHGNSEYISDAASYRQLLDQLRSTDQSQFITLVTMQNHMPYGNVYDEHDFRSTADVSDRVNQQISDYLQILHDSDAALGNLISELEGLDEKVIMVFWGDHMPGMYNPPESSRHLRYKTPLFIFSNFDMPQPARDLGVISANYLISVLLDYLNAKKPAFFYLLDDVKKHEPILTRTYHYDGPVSEARALMYYRLISYDTISGRRHAQRLGFFDQN